MQKFKKVSIYFGVFLFGIFMGTSSKTHTIEKTVEVPIEKTIEIPVEKIIEVEKVIEKNSENCEKTLNNLEVCTKMLSISGEVMQKCPEAINAVATGDTKKMTEITSFVTDSNKKMNELSTKIQK